MKVFKRILSKWEEYEQNRLIIRKLEKSILQNAEATISFHSQGPQPLYPNHIPPHYYQQLHVAKKNYYKTKMGGLNVPKLFKSK